MEFLGLIVDTVAMALKLPVEKIKKIRAWQQQRIPQQRIPQPVL